VGGKREGDQTEAYCLDVYLVRTHILGMLLAIDPGNDTGWALFDNGRRLAACGLGEPELPGPVDDLIIECPELRPHGEKNPNAILKLARNAGEWCGRLRAIPRQRYVRPNDWKGSTSKSISHARTWGKLDDKEKDIVDAAFKSAAGRDGMAASKRHNVLDAIGLGLFGVAR